MGRLSSRKPTTDHWLDRETLVIDLGARCRVLSSAPRGGGFARARYIINHQVPGNPVVASLPVEAHQRCDPSRYLSSVAKQAGADGDCVALMTAVPLRQLVALRAEKGGLWVEGFFTVGVSNAVKVGEPAVVDGARSLREDPGTINIILVTNASLTASAMVGVVQVATESKAAVLLAKAVPSWTGLPGATGTGTDAVVIACRSALGRPMLRYSGTHTVFGEITGRLVSQGVEAGLLKSTDGISLST